MADPFTIGTGIVGVISLAMEVLQVTIQFGLDWKDAPRDIKTFKAELQTLKTILLETHDNLILNPDFTEIFQNRPSILLSQLGPNAPPTTDTRLLLDVCGKELKDLLEELKKRAKGHRIGWERMKGAFLAKNTRESVETLHRQCQMLNNMVNIDMAELGVITYKEVKNVRKEQQDAKAEQQKVQENQQAWHQAGVDKELLTWLTSVDYATQQSDFISRRHKGTGQWLLKSDIFRAWINQQSQMLFCPGIPGAGKTINTAIVIDELYTKFQNAGAVGIAYIFCNFRRSHEQKPIDLLLSLLKQLIQGLPSIPQSIQQLYEQHRRNRTRPLLDEISQALQSIVRGYSKTFILIDALDECPVPDGGRNQFIAELCSLQLTSTANFFVTSREIPDIVEKFKDRSTKIEIRANDDDLEKYLDGNMSKLPSFVSHNIDLQKEIKSTIIKTVDGMFLLAQLHLDSLIGKRSPKAIRAALEKLPKGSEAYHQAYRETMERIEGQVKDSCELAKQVLSWITCAKRPLTTLELQHALAVEEGESELDEESIPEIKDMVSVCGGLVTVDEDSKIIRLVHYTTQEFFERTQKDWFPDAEKDIAMICISYLSFDVFESGFCLSNEDFVSRMRSNPLYGYAARNWGYHIREAPDAQFSIPNFLESKDKVSSCSQAMMVLYKQYGERYTQYVPRQMTGVHLTAWFGLTQITTMLIYNEHLSDCKNEDGCTPLSYTARNGHEAVVKLLMTRDDVEADSKDKFDCTPLMYAAVKGHEAVVKLLMTRDDVEMNSKDNDGRTPLLYAAWNGHEAVVKLLMTRDDVEMNSKDNDGRTPLSFAADDGHEAVVKLLMTREDVETNSKDKFGRTPLSYAALYGCEAVVKLLMMRKDVDIDSKDRNGQTPLNLAAKNGHSRTVELLLKNRDINVGDKAGLTGF